MFRRDAASDRQQTAEHKIAPTDLVVNPYPFEDTAAKPDLKPVELIENIDIDGPTMVQPATKNFESVAVVTDPADYAAVAAEIAAHGEVSLATLLELARKAFALTTCYDGNIATELEHLAASTKAISEATHRCAKRQLTWFCKEPLVHLLPGFGDDAAIAAAAERLVAGHLRLNAAP